MNCPQCKSTKHVKNGMVGDRQRPLPERLGALHQRLDLGETVEERVLGVRVEVGEPRSHALSILGA